MNGNARKLRDRLRRCERKLHQEKKKYGAYDDGAGHRYEIGPLYMLLGEDAEALAAFRWYEKEFRDDRGEPGHLLCWTLALLRAGDETGAAHKLRQAMLSNLYLVPHLLEAPIERLPIWHRSNHEEPEYLAYIPESYLRLWTEAEREWAKRAYESLALARVRARYIEISEALHDLRPGPKRTRLVREPFALME